MMDRRIEWQPVTWLAPVVTASGFAVLAAVVAGRFDLVVFAAPMLGALAGAWWGFRPERMLGLEASRSAERVLEGESTRLTVRLTAPAGVELVDVRVETSEQLTVSAGEYRRPAPDTVCGDWELTARSWGRGWARLRVTARGAGGLLTGSATCAVTEVAVFPHADRIGEIPRPSDLPDLLGLHLGRRKGEGVEFAGIREYQPGDRLRSINWLVSARRGSWYVTERLAVQAAKLVVLIDASSDIRQSGASTLELSVHGALAVTRAALRRGDRAGVVALGGLLRWLPPDSGRGHFYRIMEALLDVQPGAGAVPGDPTSLPASVLPLDAAVIVFSPLLDDRVVYALRDLRRRGHAMAVVDVLRAEPHARPGADYDEVAVRMWRLGRRGLRHELVDLGIPVGEWAEDTELAEVLLPMSRRPLPGVRR